MKAPFKLLALGVLVGVGLYSQSSRPAADPPRGEGPALWAVGAIQPRLSSDGQSIVFSYQGQIWRVPAAGGVMRRLAGGPGYAFEPCWSPDGQRIAFLQSKAWGSGQLKIIDAATGKLLAEPAEVTGIGAIAFSADGRAIFGNLRKPQMLESLRRLDLQSGELKTVVRLRSPRHPWALSPDGKWLAYITTQDLPDQQQGNNGPEVDVWKMPVAGGEPQKLYRFPARIHALCWSADQSLYASSELGGAYYAIWQTRLDQPERHTKLTFGEADEDWPSVSADGRWLLHADNQEGTPGLVLRDRIRGEWRKVPITGLDYGVPTGRLCIRIDDPSEPAVARVALEHTDGGFHAPPGALWRIFYDHAHFHVTGSQTLEVPAGSYRLRAFRGPEYRPVDLNVEVKAGAETEAVVKLQRWTDSRARGWYSGDNHIHANYGYGAYFNTPATMWTMMQGEDLHVCNYMIANSDGDGVFDRFYFLGRPDPLSDDRVVLYWNEEWRSTTWGHMTLVNLKQIVEPVYLGFKGTTNPHDVPSVAEIAERTRLQGGLVNYTHPASRPDDLYAGPYTARGLPVYAALGQVDTIDVAGNYFFPATSLYYHKLLNCGFRLGASAGTDVFLNHVRGNLPGGGRVYVKVDGPFTYEKWIDALRAGRSFVTNGPMVEFTADGQPLGETLKLDGPGQVRVKAKAASQFPLDRVEVLYNGKVAASVAPAKDGPTELSETIAVDRSGWLALRVGGPARPETRGDNLYAHTSPIYVTVAGRPAGSAEDARYFLAWIDTLWTTVQARDRFPSSRHKAAIEKEIEQARAVYRRIIDRQDP